MLSGGVDAYAAETEDHFLARIADAVPHVLVEEHVKRKFAKASPEERELWMWDPFEERDVESGEIDYHAAKGGYRGLWNSGI